MPLLTCLSRTWAHIQDNLFPWLTEELGPLTEAHKRVVMTLELAGGGVCAVLARAAGSAAARPGGAGARLCGQGGARTADDLDADRAAHGGQAIAPAVRLGTPRTGSQRGNLLARLRGVCAERIAGPPARGADQAEL